MEDEPLYGVDIQAIQFKSGEMGELLVEITYSEPREQANGIAMFRMILFDAKRASSTVADILETAQGLVEEMLVEQANPAPRIPGTNVRFK